MLDILGLNRFYYIRNFMDMRCKHARILSVIREQLYREPSKSDVFIVLSKDRRTVRPFTTKRKNSLHFGSDEGAEIAAVYHSIISTVKLQGRSVWDYLGKFFTGIFNGCRDFLSLAPQNIDLAVCQ